MDFDEDCFPYAKASDQTTAPSKQPEWPTVDTSDAEVPQPTGVPIPVLGPVHEPVVRPEAPASLADQPHESGSPRNSSPEATDQSQAPEQFTQIQPGSFSVQLPLAPDTSHRASIPMHTYQRRRKPGPQEITNSQEQSNPSSRRITRIPSRLKDYYLHLTEKIPTVSLPVTVEAALSHPGWKAAMDSELESIHKNDTWDLVSLPPNRTAIATKWVFRVKTNADGSTAKLKARLVAKGFQQKEGLDYTETFAPVVKWNTLRSVVALAGHRGWKIFHLDVKTAFLNGIIEEDIFVSPPPEFSSQLRSNQACKLKKALYGLKQAPRAWYSKVDSYLLGQGLLKSNADYNLYLHEADGKIALVILYVDDLYLTGDDTQYIERIRTAIQQEFEMTDLGLLSYSLGLEFLFLSEGILVTQRQYIRDMLCEFSLDQCRSVATPMTEKLKLTPDMQAPPADAQLYQRMVGKLIFLTNTRPDIAYPVSVVSRFMAHPQEPHLQAVKHIYRYLQGTIDFGLLYRQGEDDDLYGFTDADWAGDSYDRKSTTGYLFMMGSTPITWNSKKQPTVALSSTESEYMAITEGTKEALWLRRLFGELKVQNPQDSTFIYGDNQGSLNLSHNPIYHGRTKHIEVRHHFIREKILSGEINLEYVPTDEQLADIMTKALGRTAFERLRNQLGLVRIDAHNHNSGTSTKS